MRLLRAAVAAAVMVLLLAAPTMAGLVSADLQVAKTDSPDPVVAGANITYTITVTNAGPGTAQNVSFSDPVPTGTTFVSFTSPGGWTSSTPAVGGTGTVTSTNPSLAVGSAVFTLVVQTSAALANGTVITNVASASSINPDPNPNDNNSTPTSTTVSAAVASVPNAAMPEPQTGSPFAVLGFGALLASVLATAAVLNRRRYRS